MQYKNNSMCPSIPHILHGQIIHIYTSAAWESIMLGHKSWQLRGQETPVDSDSKVGEENSFSLEELLFYGDQLSFHENLNTPTSFYVGLE